ncbi:uncharacterized protein ATC70_012410 [Mucor velutinosus]|uniref:PH domain-containing protein n=1 Tax=Mucor velutinosus TaxID=708070 RepID=A0AAN7DAY5_9FUNG|nr:hypothetical protein ATC70_012410 [Mucor velutinosus]
MATAIEEELILDWTTAIEALDLISIQEIFDMQPELLWTPLQPLAHLENDFSHFINKLEDFKLLGTSIRPVYALHHILFDYGLEGDEWAPERIELVDFILKHTKRNELNTCLWGKEQNTVMHLAYLINQPELTQQLMDKGALTNIPNKSGHLPTKQTTGGDDATNTNAGVTPENDVNSTATSAPPASDKPTKEDTQPEVKLLISKSKAAAVNKERIPANASDRFKRLRELAESPNANSSKPISERQNSTRRYFRPGHLEERRRRVLSEEEEAELEKQRLKRQKEVEMLAQRSAVKNNPLFRKFEEQTQGQQQQQGKPVISAVSAIRDRKKLLGAADQIRRSSRVINSLKDRSYVSGSVFRQQSDTAAGPNNNENELKVPTLAQLRAGSSAPTTSISRETSPNVSDNEEEGAVEPLKNKSESSKSPIEDKHAITTPTKENISLTTDAVNNPPETETSAVNNETKADSLAVTKEEPSVKSSKEDVKLDTPVSKVASNANNAATATKTAENDIEALSVGKLSLANKEVKSTSAATDTVGSSKVKQIVNVHEHLNDEEAIEIYSTGKVFSVWKKNEYGELVEEKQEKSIVNKEAASKVIDESIDNFIDRSVSKPIDKAIDKPTIDKSADKSIKKSIDNPTEKPTDRSIDKSIGISIDKSTAFSDGNNKILKPSLPAKSKSRPTSRAISAKKEAHSDTTSSAVPNSDKDRQGSTDKEKMTEPNLAGSRSINHVSNTPEVQEEQQLMSMPRDASTKEHRRVSQDDIVDHTLPIALTSVSLSTVAHEEKSRENKEEHKDQQKVENNAMMEEFSATTFTVSAVPNTPTTSIASTTPTTPTAPSTPITPTTTTYQEDLSLATKSTTIIDRKLDTFNNRLKINTTTASTTSSDDEDDQDQDSATTPTLANPQPEQQKQLDALLNQRDNFEFHDDTNQIDNRTSYCSDTNETSILRSFNMQQEEHFDQWTQDNRKSATAAAAKKRQSGSQRNYWSTGIQMVDAAAAAKKRESVASSVAAQSMSETGSEQWFDPDDDWTVDSRRQSQMKANRQSDSSNDSSAFSYKHSDLTENTRLEDDDDDQNSDEYSYYKQQVRYDHITSQSQQEHVHYDGNDDENDKQQRQESYYSTDGHAIPSRFDGRESVIDVLPPSLRSVSNDGQEDNDYTTSLHSMPPQPSTQNAQPRQLHTTTLSNNAIATATIDRHSDSEKEDYYSTNLHAKSADTETSSRQLNTTAIPHPIIATAVIEHASDGDDITKSPVQSTLPNHSEAHQVHGTAASPIIMSHGSAHVDDAIQDDYYSTNLHTSPSQQGQAPTTHDSHQDVDDSYYSTHLHTNREPTVDAPPRQLTTATATTSTASLGHNEEDDYYSTMLHTKPSSPSNRTEAKGMSSYYQHNDDNDQDDHEQEGEITVFMNHQFHQSSEQVVAHNQSMNSLHSSTSEPAPQRDFLSVKTEIHDNDDTYSLYKVPSRTVDIADAGTVQASVPHDPNHPRVEDISHYMNALPVLGSNSRDVGGSVFDLDQQQDAIVKRAIATKDQAQLDTEAALPTTELNPIRGIPNAHEVNEHFMSNMQAIEEGKISMSSMEASQYGKMYIGVSGAHHMLLPLPKEITYVRCVISDGEYEYMSRYEILGHQILMDYECVIDTKPGMIITVSLHVRPDYHVKPRTGWSRWFTSIRKQKEHLSGYVHPDDGAIGQTRFAVDHMVPGCYKKTYEAHFDCFNSWYARTNRERARREQFGDEEDFLKIVGKLNVEMLYLPVSNPSVQVPRSLRECDLTLKIRQWHDTCWQSGYLTTRCQGNKIWERHFYRLIGSQLIGYTSEDNGSDRQVWDHYNIADVLKLSAAADKVIITLMEEDTSKVFTDSIHSSDTKGFFRLTFSDYYLDCVSDDLDDSEEWVRTLKSMIGRVPLRLPFSD